MQFQRRIFLITLIVVGLIFVLGLLLGFKFDEWRTDETQILLTETKIDSESFVVEADFISTFGLDSCTALKPRLNSLSKNLVEVGTKLNEYDLKKMSETIEFDILKRSYFLLELSSLTLNKKLKDQCNSSGFNIIYFYNFDQEDSIKQGYVLDTFVRSSENVHIFSFDYGFSEPAVDALKAYYNITSTPTIILDFEDKKEGYYSFGALVSYYNAK